MLKCEAQLFMNVFGLGVDTSLQCFIAAEEMGISEERVVASGIILVKVV